MTDMTHAYNIPNKGDELATNDREASASSARVQILHETSLDMGSGWKVCLQWCRYVYNNGALESGYRFIWRRPDGSLQAARGQARLPSMTLVRQLISQAEADGWGNLKDA
jgi:hypothetical protein